MKEYFTQNSMKPGWWRMLLDSTIHNCSSKENYLARTLKQIWCLTTPCFFNLSISLLLWNNKINTEINAIFDLLACVRKVYDNDKNIIHLGQRPPRCWGPRLQPTKPIGKSGTELSSISLIFMTRTSFSNKSYKYTVELSMDECFDYQQ
jgi:hypothetical protein